MSNIRLKKYQIVELDGLKGVSGNKIKACFVNKESCFDLREILRCGFAVTSAGDNGAFNIWMTDDGELKGELLRYCVIKDSATFHSILDAKNRIDTWMTLINF